MGVIVIDQIPLVGQALWINLVNTRFISNGVIVDVLKDKTSTMKWLLKNNLINNHDLELLNITDKNIVNLKLRKLREICFSTIQSIENEECIPEDTVSDLMEFSKDLNVKVTINKHDGVISENIIGVTLNDHILYKIVKSMLQTFDTISITRIRKCKNDECILHFVDKSKGGKRKWCDMETCGNRVKAASFYKRKRENTRK
ncbi:CGNR zinc finger domain-containing protein [Bacillus subtilis]|nr:CGNR zinc finger domain-containing protein [Bacillus subtilis]